MKLLTYLSFPRPVFRFLGIALFGSLVVHSPIALALDGMPINAIDATSVAGTSSARTLSEGSAAATVILDTAQKALPLPQDQQSKAGLLKNAYRANIMAGYGIARNLDLSLGIHATSEFASPADRDRLLTREDANNTWHGKVKETAFSGMSLALKYQFASWNDLKLAVMPFVVSGVGTSGRFALTRSSHAEVGALLAGTYSKSSLFDISLNSGYLVRRPESFGDLMVQNEIFYRMMATVYVTKDLGIFALGLGRHDYVKPTTSDENVPAYKAPFTGELGGGLVATIGGSKISAFLASPINEKKTSSNFGFLKTYAGIGFTMPLGHSDSAYDVEETSPKQQAAQPVTEKKVDPQDELRKLYPEMYVSEIDPLETEKAIPSDNASPDDFDVIKSKIVEEQKLRKKGWISDDEKLESELDKIHEAERKQEAEKIRREKAEAKLQEKIDRESWEKDSARAKKLQQEAKARANKMRNLIKDEDVEWKGLED